MKIIESIALATLLSSLLLGAQTKEEKELKYADEMGKKGSALLLKTLGTNMKHAMKSGGVMKALSFCSNEAYALTQEVNQKLPVGVRVRRISTKYRSPANAPQENEVKILEALLSLESANVIPPQKIVEKVDKDTYKYYTPLTINNKVCLKCHGKVADIDLRRAIAERYPLDKATGYEMDDLRGAVVVTIKRK